MSDENQVSKQSSLPTSPSSSAEGYGRTQQELIEPVPEITPVSTNADIPVSLKD